MTLIHLSTKWQSKYTANNMNWCNYTLHIQLHKPWQPSHLQQVCSVFLCLHVWQDVVEWNVDIPFHKRYHELGTTSFPSQAEMKHRLDLVCRKQAVSNSRPACRKACLKFVIVALLVFTRVSIGLCCSASMSCAVQQKFRSLYVCHTRVQALCQHGWTCHRNSFTVW